MLDFRIHTFLKLCELMNYHQTAFYLNMTQPSVTQHIKYLENKYNISLFTYQNKKLIKTPYADIFEKYCRSVINIELDLNKELMKENKKTYKIGATKTIGEYVILDSFKKLLKQDKYNLSLIVDNTKNLLEQLDNSTIDIAAIEGNFDKSKYDYSFYKKEKLIAICSKNHIFSNKTISFEELIKQTIICREEGSGTRNILEVFLNLKNYKITDFKSIITISEFKILKELVEENIGISFVYESVVDNNLSTFQIKDFNVEHNFNYVYLKNTNNKDIIKILKG